MARVLIGYSACPLTRAAFEAQGCNVWTCDLLPARDGSPKHYQCDIWEVLGQEWDMAVLHPMCTYLTVSAAWAYGDGPYHQKVKPETLVGAARRAARDEAIENFRQLLALPFPVAIENPASSFVSKALRGPDQSIQPWQFGDDASKATGLWLKDLPPLTHTAYIAPRIVDGRPRWANQTDSGQNRLIPSATRWLERSKTYPGIAAAMGDQWGKMAQRKELPIMNHERAPLKGWRTWGDNHCDHCCNGDRCDDPSHRSREHCQYCQGTGRAIWLDDQAETPAQEVKS